MIHGNEFGLLYAALNSSKESLDTVGKRLGYPDPEARIREMFPVFRDEPYLLWIEFALRINACAAANGLRLEAEHPVEHVACRAIAYRLAWNEQGTLCVIRTSVGPEDKRDTQYFTR